MLLGYKSKHYKQLEKPLAIEKVISVHYAPTILHFHLILHYGHVNNDYATP